MTGMSNPKNDREVAKRIEASGVGVDERIAHLCAALEHIQAIRVVLNTARRQCKCCGVTIYEDFGDAQLADRLDAWLRKMGAELGRYQALRYRLTAPRKPARGR